MDNEMIFRVSQVIRDTPNASDYDVLVAVNAIKAMREPTENMVASAWHKDKTSDIYRSMIDAVLND